MTASVLEKPMASSATVRLTRREIEVLSYIAQGHSSKKVADFLFVSKRTVDFHLANTYSKLKASNRVQALRNAERCGLLPFEPTSDSCPLYLSE